MNTRKDATPRNGDSHDVHNDARDARHDDVVQAG